MPVADKCGFMVLLIPLFVELVEGMSLGETVDPYLLK